jgi:membrane protease YdiL (CAAX protease family)
VFPKPPKTVERLPGSSKWSWDDETSGAGQQQQQQQGGAAAERLWNPKTGFMRTRAELEQEQAAAAAAAASNQPQAGAAQAATQPVASNSSSSSSGVVERLQDVPNPLQAPQLPRSALANSAAAAAAGQQQPASGELPAVGRGQVLTSCALTAAAMAGAAVGLSVLVAPRSAALLGTSQEAVDRLLQLPPGLQDVQQVGVMLGAAAAVTAARFLLKQQWPEFREASDRSNQQVLTSLGWPDVVLVALLSGVSEELLFRWALIGCTWPDARGVLLSGAVFGVLHVSGGRNAAFAAWASAVGCLYGAAFLATGNVWVPAGAHAIANFASAAAWISSNKGQQE